MVIYHYKKSPVDIKTFSFFGNFYSKNFLLELLEVLHANDTIDLAQNIINEFDTDHDGKLSVEGKKKKKTMFYKVIFRFYRINRSY